MQYNNRDMADYPHHVEAQHEYHDRGINYYARVAEGVPAPAHAIAPLAPVCINLIFPYTCI